MANQQNHEQNINVTIGNLDAEIDFLTGKWKRKVNGHDPDLALNENFVTYAFEFLDDDEYPARKLVKTLVPLSSFGDYSIVDCDHKKKPRRIKNPVLGTYGYEEYHIDGIKGPSLWRINETTTAGVNIRAYREDDKYFSKLAKNWDTGKYIWLDSRIADIGKFLEDLDHLAEAMRFQEIIRVTIIYRGLLDRNLNSPFPEETLPTDCVACKQDEKIITRYFNTGDIDGYDLYSAVAGIAKDLSSLFNSAPVKPKKIRKILWKYM